jgi:selenocysteine-specific elongation factor
VKQIILGTAGHVDHGKTSLIKALTGVDLDRLKEEKARGITIKLGFTSLELPGGGRLGIVDVPGHERFVKNMVAGVGGIDIVMLTVAADEGVMPQTREHMEICSLLGIERGLMAVTKVDLVDAEWMDLLYEELREFARGTVLEGAPVVALSSATGQGIQELLVALERLAEQAHERPREGIFRLPIDRVFTVRGFGTVVTGTLVSGSVRVGDGVELLPEGLEAKVRNLQAYGRSVDEASPGLRVAANLHGVEKASVEPGMVLTHPGTLGPTIRIDAFLAHLTSAPKPLASGVRVRLHTGTSEVLARVILKSRKELSPGESAFVQFRLDGEAVVLPWDRFVIRSYSPIRTIGGGEVVDPWPRKFKGRSADKVRYLEVVQRRRPEEVIPLFVSEAGFSGLTVSDLVSRTGWDRSRVTPVVEKMEREGTVTLIDSESLKVVHSERVDEMKKVILTHLEEFHVNFPLQTGLLKEELKTKVALADPRLFHKVLSQLVDGKLVQIEKERVSLHDFRPEVKGEQAGLQQKALEIYKKADLKPPTLKELVAKLSADEREVKDLVNLLIERGDLVKVKEGFSFHRGAITRLEKGLVQFLKENGEITPAQFKELIGASRKFAIPLMEHFDQKKVTIRVGDKRVLRGKRVTKEGT